MSMVSTGVPHSKGMKEVHFVGTSMSPQIQLLDWDDEYDWFIRNGDFGSGQPKLPNFFDENPGTSQNARCNDHKLQINRSFGLLLFVVTLPLVPPSPPTTTTPLSSFSPPHPPLPSPQLRPGLTCSTKRNLVMTVYQVGA